MLFTSPPANTKAPQEQEQDQATNHFPTARFFPPPSFLLLLFSCSILLVLVLSAPVFFSFLLLILMFVLVNGYGYKCCDASAAAPDCFE
jgi:hypothetical protein